MISVDLSSPAKRILEAAEVLKHSWNDTLPHWNDGNARNLQATYLEPLGRDINQALYAIRQIQETLNRMNNECRFED